LTRKDKETVKKEGKLKEMQDEIERRKFLEKKVQKYVKSMIKKSEEMENKL